MINNADGLPPYENAIAGRDHPVHRRRAAPTTAASWPTTARPSPSSPPGTRSATRRTATSPTSPRPARAAATAPSSRTSPRPASRCSRPTAARPARARACRAPRWPRRPWPASRRSSSRRIPGWDPRDIKAAIMGTASAGKVSPYDVRIAGAGLAQPRRAVDTVAFVYTDPGSSSLTFGLQEAGNAPGHLDLVHARPGSMTIRNTSLDGHPVRPEQHLQRQCPGRQGQHQPELGERAREAARRPSPCGSRSPRAPWRRCRPRRRTTLPTSRSTASATSTRP